MFKYILPSILIIVAITGFFMFINPYYNDISAYKTQIASYNEALDNSKALEAQRDLLTQKYSSFDPNNLSRLQKLLPDNVDNIRLILEIENIASPYGMVLKDVRYDATDTTTTPQTTATGVAQKGKVSSGNNFGVWNLEFSTQGTYDNFIKFVKDLENNLRIVDISSIQFSSGTGTGTSTGLNPSSVSTYKYDFKIKTYWLKN